MSGYLSMMVWILHVTQGLDMLAMAKEHFSQRFTSPHARGLALQRTTRFLSTPGPRDLHWPSLSVSKTRREQQVCHARPHTSYTVFLSHSGTVKRGIVGFLQNAFKEAGISCFFDDIALKYGDMSENIMLEAAKSAEVGVVVLTPCYLTKCWPLLELELFLKNKKMFILPIFHTMSPGDCYNLSESPHKDIAVPQGWDFSTVAALLRALTKRCGIRSTAVDGYDYMVVARAVDSVVRYLEKGDQGQELQGMIGMAERVDSLRPQLCSGGNVAVLNLYGSGGCGKTALARALFHDTGIQNYFGKHCAMVCVGPPAEEEAEDQKRLLGVQNVLLTELFGGGSGQAGANDLKEGRRRLGLRTTKVLVILDDVWQASDITQLLPLDRLKPGSCVVATSRRVDLLKRMRLEPRVILCSRHVESLTADEARRLFCQSAFMADEQPADSPVPPSLVQKVQRLCGHLPLSLHIVGSSLYRSADSLDADLDADWDADADKDFQEEWEAAARVLENAGSFGEGWADPLFGRLRTSYDRLQDCEKETFLDIAIWCHLRPWKTARAVLQAIDAHKPQEPAAKSRWATCLNRCLFRVNEHGQVAVHMALRLFVAAQAQQRNGAGNMRPRAARRRLMKSDVAAKLAAGESLQVESAVMNQHAFKHMKAGILPKAQALWVIGAQPGSTRETAAMRGALLRVAAASPGLRALVLEDCLWVDSIPREVTQLRSLRLLHAEGCAHLRAVTSQIDRLRGLRCMNLSRCSGLTELPDSIGNLTALKSLSLSGCPLLRELPSSLEGLKSLRRLDLRGSGVAAQPLPAWLERMKSRCRISL